MPLVIIFLLLVGCASKPPLEDFTLARAAINAAKQYESDRFAPGIWFKAEDAYRQGQENFKKENYDDAQENFILARKYAEQSENKARIEKYRSGEGGR